MGGQKGNMMPFPRESQQNADKDIKAEQGDDSVKPGICIEQELRDGSTVFGFDKRPKRHQDKQNGQQGDAECDRADKAEEYGEKCQRNGGMYF